MSRSISRRRLLGRAGTGVLAAGAGGLSAGIIGAPYIARAQTLVPVRTGTLFGGWAHLGNDTLLEMGFDKKHGFACSVHQTYNVLATYYADFAKGSFDFGVGSWDFFARAYMQGAPVRIIGMISEGTQAGYLGRADGPKTLKDLKGKTLAAMQASGTYQMAKAFAKEFDGLEFEKDVTIQNAPNPPGTIALLAGNRADAALTWEQSLSLGLDMVKDSRIFVNLGDYFTQHTKMAMPYFCIAMHNSAIERLPPGSVAKVVAMFDDLSKWINANVDEYAARAPRIQVEPRVIKAAIESKRLRFQMRSAADTANRKDVLFTADLLTKAGMFPRALDEKIFAV